MGNIIFLNKEKAIKNHIKNTLTYNTTLYSYIKSIWFDNWYDLLSEKRREKFNKENIWGSKFGDIKLNKSYRYFGEKLVNHTKWVDEFLEQIKNLEGKNTKSFTLIEIGCAYGELLNYISKKIVLKEFIGIDLSSIAINENKKKYKQIKFFNDTSENYLNYTSNKNLIFVFKGTLEYFTQNEISTFLKKAKNNSNKVYIILNEPSNINNKITFQSKMRGNIAYSHNYKFLLENENFNLDNYKEHPIDLKINFYNNIILLASV